MAESDGAGSAEVSAREAVWRMYVWGIETVMMMRRGGWGDAGAVAGSAVSEDRSLGSRIVLCCY